MDKKKVVIKQESEVSACEKLNLDCPFEGVNGSNDCCNCVFQNHTVREIQEIIYSHYNN